MLDRKIQQYLQLTAYAIATDDSISMKTEDVDWQGYYRFCEEQAILGVGLHAIKKLKQCHGLNIEIPKVLLLEWIGVTEMMRQQNAVVDKRVKELTKYLRAQELLSCILKGQGNALMYPDSAMRTPGDIDVWIQGTKKEVATFVHQRFPDMNVQYHHMSYPIFEDVEVEVHYYPSFCYNKWHNYRLQRFFRESNEAQFNNVNSDGYAVPTNTFNLVFQLSHMMRHFFTQGIGLRHAIDYYYLLQQDISDKEKQVAIDVMKRCGMYKFLCAVLWIEKEILGLKKNTDIAFANEKVGNLVLREMLKGGNLGHQYELHNKNVIAVYAKQMIYRLRFVSEFPSEPLSRPFALSWDLINKNIF